MAKLAVWIPGKKATLATCSSAWSPLIFSMRAAANFAFCNRQLLMWQTREVFKDVFGRSWSDMDMQLVYDITHNIAKFEKHRVNGQEKT